MKKISLIVIGTLLFLNITAQTAANGKITITGTRFTYPLLKEWVSGFRKKYPDVSIGILQKGDITNDSANLFISAHELEESEIRSGYHLLKIAEYAILPVTNRNNPWLPALRKSGLDKKKIKEIFFDKEYDPIYNEHIKSKIKKSEFNVNIYTRDQKGCAPIAFANYYDLKQENIVGKRILGDDKGLIAAVAKDSIGVSYNNAGYIYDLTTRKVQEPLAVIPIDQNANGKVDAREEIYGDLDQFLCALQSGDTRNIPRENVTIAVPVKIKEENRNIRLFVEYILDEGRKKNKQYGFLELTPEDVRKQLGLFETDEASIFPGDKDEKK